MSTWKHPGIVVGWDGSVLVYRLKGSQRVRVMRLTQKEREIAQRDNWQTDDEITILMYHPWPIGISEKAANV